MKYPPQHHQDDNRDHLKKVIKNYPLATVISVKDNTPLVTHLPLVYENEKLIGHIDIYNPQASLLKDGNEVTVVFYGPQCYISPSIYGTTQLPTWNYIRVHLKGIVKAIESKSALKQSLITMTEFLEAPDHKYVLEPDNPRLDRNLNYIEMFEIDITEWEGKFKLSQDKKPSDTEFARQELIRANQESIKRFLDQIF
ncbi:FMN-binding negative transcriptional regulator [Psychroserpens sp.]|uniref:FMN-binding negative transcriptional regulator n=1 Tax=Psychroserpens sp. TaxID=2020870 RepID=UPI001B151344|nr:FMN-binding negative transcriptional regulator [Psychroserpens sp.]MBO6606197.1 FMN-binding negative transcriptional regulator [Psychroserpens sp.]MBO6631103.1 FMN-binding negative transcriptional regulator [Psychroserpens sp.]MBO6652431.1 FMN-binding negative transcriptional regulator [Psychroserpens sp.]MBO6681797.1 FMN-binding negative transcriptional regulator [Psychroserpens sp.]MBO6749572.1 FMN-binding negative transcriptional regulator [Psychroserpens sp.]